MALALKADHSRTRRRPSLACALPRHRPRPRRDRFSVTTADTSPWRCPLPGEDRKSWADRQNDANDRAPRGRELSV